MPEQAPQRREQKRQKSPQDIFDRALVRKRRDRAAKNFRAHDFLFHAVAERLAERLADVRRSWPVALDLGCHDGTLGRLLSAGGRIGTLYSCDLSAAMLANAGGIRVQADEEFLPFAPSSLDLVVSSLSLHWVNDLPGCFLQLRQALKPDGFFLAALAGGETLSELAHCLVAAEHAVTGKVSPRVSPFAGMADIGGLLQRAGFALPVVDSEKITVSYGSIAALMKDVRGMGAGNALSARENLPLSRRILQAAEREYQGRFATADGRIDATFDIIFLAGWAPHASQQQPRPRGSAQHSLADFLQNDDG